MKVVLDIQKEFEEEYNSYRFKNTFRRVIADIKHDLENGNLGLSGNYEIETLEMLMKAFEDSWEIRFKYLEYATDDALRLEEAYHKVTKI